MRGWTETSFHKASGEAAILWLAPRPAPRRLDALDRLGTRVGRFALLVACGFLVSGVLPGSAFGPVAPAQAARADLRLDAVLPPEIVPGLPADLVAAPSPLPDESGDIGVRPGLDPSAAADADPILRFGARALPRDLVLTIMRAAAATEVDPTYLMALADKESSFRTDVRASTSSAEGLFQFIERTWLETVRGFGARHGLAEEAAAIRIVDERPVVADEAERSRILALRRDPYLAAVMAAELLRSDSAQIGFQVGRALTATELYLAHFLGLEDATRFIALRSAAKPPSATAAFPAAARANAAIFFERARRGRRGLTVPEVYARLDRMIGERVATFRSVRDVAGLPPQPGV